MKKRMITVILIALCLSTGVVFAEVVGKLSLEKGFVKLRRSAIDTVYQEKGTEVEVHGKDEIQTAAHSLVKIQLHESGDEIAVFSNSLFIISDVGRETTSVSMPVGKSRLQIKPRRKVLKGRRRFRLKTTNAIIGVKGTDFIVGVHDGNTSLLTLEGAVSLSNISEPEVEVEVKLNQASQIKQNTRPTTPIVVPLQAREEIIASDTPAAFSSVQFGEEVAPVKSGTDKKKEGKSESTESPKEESADDETADDEGELGDVELDEILDEVDDIVDDVIEETETGPTEVEVTIDILE